VAAAQRLMRILPEKAREQRTNSDRPGTSNRGDHRKLAAQPEFQNLEPLFPLEKAAESSCRVAATVVCSS